ncbi:MAG: threonine synthase [Candidatus Omnitrophica bacterium]|nr:threonine synthase [Candidatus Omnitrophota bacterium]
MKWTGLINKYREFLPVTDKTPVVTLNEGNTPLISSPYFSSLTGMEVYLKYEGLNPTGSFKDRGMTMAISKAKEEGVKAVMCASTGNTSASASAYAARAGMKSFVLIPDGNIALGKLAQAMIHNATVIAIKGNFDQALEMVVEVTKKYPIALVNSINPFRIEGQKTAAFEICDFLDDAPEFHAIPVGNAGNITAYWKGYKEYKQVGKSKQLPKMLGFQAAGSAPIVLGHPVKKPETIATAIKIGNPASWKFAEAARDESKGLIDMVTDDEILEAYKLLAKFDGVFAEPASAASVAGIIKLNKSGYFKGQKGRIVCTLTGHGLKDPNIALKCVGEPMVINPDMNELIKTIGI